MLFRSRGGGGGVGSSEETGERQRNREQMRSPLADRNERNVTGHFISKTTGKDESEKERREREFAGVKKKQNEAKKTTTKTTASVSVCPDIIREYRETTSTRSLTENEIQINSRDDALNSVGEEEEALKTKISTSTRTKNSYKKMKLLGKGGFAIVYSVKDLNKKPSDDGVETQSSSSSSYNYYAAKVVSKKNLERQKQKDKMLAEIRIHRASEH
jgi:hypothetical protein